VAYVLILTTVTAYGAVNTQQIAKFSNFHDCVAFALAWTNAGRSPDSTVRWQCQIEENTLTSESRAR
jgi:hypothetical protein